MLLNRLRRWSDIKLALVQPLISARLDHFSGRMFVFEVLHVQFFKLFKMPGV